MISRHLTGFWRKHGRISKGALERSSSTNSIRVSLLIISWFSYFHAFSILFRDVEESSSPLIQVNLLRWSNVLFTLVINNSFDLVLLYTINRVLLRVEPYSIIAGSYSGYGHATPQTQQPFYITFRRQKDHALRENYASELHQVMILHLSRAGLTSWH